MHRKMSVTSECGFTEPVTENCEEGDLRLVNGATPDEGRLEACHEDHWGSVCGDGFEFVDAFVACKSFGSLAG